jgi:hypothetical protein
MNASRLGMMVLQMRLAMARFGWLNAITLTLLLAGAIAAPWMLSYFKAQVNQPLRSLHEAERSLKSMLKDPAASSRSQPEERLAAFYDTLGDKRYAEQQLKTLFAVAGKTGLTLNQAEYRALTRPAASPPTRSPCRSKAATRRYAASAKRACKRFPSPRSMKSVSSATPSAAIRWKRNCASPCT